MSAHVSHAQAEQRASVVRLAAAFRIPRVLPRFGDRHARRQHRARHQLLGRVPEVSAPRRLAGLRSFHTGCLFCCFRCRPVRARRSPGSPPPHPAWDAALRVRVDGLGDPFFATDSLQMWHAGALLVLHGIAGVLWNPPAQALVHDIVAPQQLPGAVRLTATAVISVC